MILFTGSGALLNIICNMWMLPRIGIWGAVVATVVAYIVMAISIYFVAQKIYPIPISVRKLMSVVLMIGMIYGIYYIFDLHLLVRMGILVLYTILAWRVILTRQTRANIKSRFT